MSYVFFFQAEDGIRDYKVTEFRRVLFRSSHIRCREGQSECSTSAREGGLTSSPPGNGPESRILHSPDPPRGESRSIRRPRDRNPSSRGEFSPFAIRPEPPSTWDPGRVHARTP